jgi:hypothetical protein
MKNYSELLKDPRWQKKRLEILESDNWSCRRCEDKSNMLAVHHLYYKKGANPWEYDNSALITLCDKCHKEGHNTDWKQAFLDLNLSYQTLLDVALLFQFIVKKNDELTKPIQAKYKTRNKPEWIPWDSNMFETYEEYCEMDEWRKKQVDKYIKNG